MPKGGFLKPPPYALATYIRTYRKLTKLHVKIRLENISHENSTSTYFTIVKIEKKDTYESILGMVLGMVLGM